MVFTVGIRLNEDKCEVIVILTVEHIVGESLTQTVILAVPTETAVICPF